MLFCNADIEISIGHLLLQERQPGAIRHRRRNPHDRRILATNIEHGLPKNRGIGRSLWLGVSFDEFPFVHLKWRYSMPLDWVDFRGFVSFSLRGERVDEDRAILIFCSFQCMQKLTDVMSIDRSEIPKAK